jgi:hypothetical protein
MIKSISCLFLLFVLSCGFLLFISTNFCIIQASTDINEIPTPSVPEFTLSYKDLSYDEPPTYEIDQFTGKNVTKQEGYHVDKRSVVFKIRNQPFTSYSDASGNEIDLYYNFRFKGHFGSEWRHYPFSETGQGTRRYSLPFYTLSYESPKLAASNSEFTNITLSIPFLFGINNPKSGSLDFQVQALIGNIDYAGDGFYKFVGQTSGWSDTQTITIGEDTQTTPNDSIPEFPSWIILPLVLTVTLFLMIVKRKLHTVKAS